MTCIVSLTLHVITQVKITFALRLSDIISRFRVVAMFVTVDLQQHFIQNMQTCSRPTNTCNTLLSLHTDSYRKTSLGSPSYCIFCTSITAANNSTPTRYGLDGPGIDLRQARIFPTQHPIIWVPVGTGAEVLH